MCFHSCLKDSKKFEQTEKLVDIHLKEEERRQNHDYTLLFCSE